MTKRAPAQRAPSSGITDDRLIELAVSGKSYRAIAAIVGLDHSTVYGRLQKPACKAAVEEGREVALAEARGILRAHSTKLARKLVKIGKGEIKGSSEQVRAITVGLRLAGLETTRRVEHTGSLRVLSDAELDAQEAKLLAAMGEDGEP